jgi:hypothetical protein
MADAFAAVIATLVALAFSLSTFERYLVRRRRNELAWSIALFLFAVASASLALGASDGWSGPTYRVFFLFGGVVNVPVLATGTIYLLFSRRVGDITFACVALGSAFATGIIASTPFTHPLPRHSLAQASHVFPALPEVLAGVGSGGATVVIVIGAVVSVIRYRRGRMAIANTLIAIGTLVTGASGLLNSVFDKMTAFAVSLSVGILVIFVGFLIAAPTAGRAPSGRGARLATPGPES